jgi:hypothetical protein
VLESFGAVGAWEIYADDRLGCSEVYLQDRVECELLQGGWVVLDAEGEILAFRNAAVPLVSALISPEGVRCIERPEVTRGLENHVPEAVSARARAHAGQPDASAHRHQNADHSLTGSTL